MRYLIALALLYVLTACDMSSDPTSEYPVPVNSEKMAEEFEDDPPAAYDKYVGKSVILTAGELVSTHDNYVVLDVDFAFPDIKCLADAETWPEDTEYVITGIVRGLDLSRSQRNPSIVIENCALRDVATP